MSRALVGGRVRACVRACVRAYVCVCVRVCVRVCVCVAARPARPEDFADEQEDDPHGHEQARVPSTYVSS
jgi:hypothetical protein